ncbi:TPA: hypothetical protein NG614_000049 [Vibrio parahaemolyticus]|nr:hypothetical protein [Vibrio parahaemolyticus]
MEFLSEDEMDCIVRAGIDSIIPRFIRPSDHARIVNELLTYLKNNSTFETYALMELCVSSESTKVKTLGQSVILVELKTSLSRFSRLLGSLYEFIDPLPVYWDVKLSDIKDPEVEIDVYLSRGEHAYNVFNLTSKLIEGYKKEKLEQEMNRSFALGESWLSDDDFNGMSSNKNSYFSGITSVNQPFDENEISFTLSKSENEQLLNEVRKEDEFFNFICALLDVSSSLFVRIVDETNLRLEVTLKNSVLGYVIECYKRIAFSRSNVYTPLSVSVRKEELCVELLFSVSSNLDSVVYLWDHIHRNDNEEPYNPSSGQYVPEGTQAKWEDF